MGNKNFFVLHMYHSQLYLLVVQKSARKRGCVQKECESLYSSRLDWDSAPKKSWKATLIKMAPTPPIFAHPSWLISSFSTAWMIFFIKCTTQIFCTFYFCPTVACHTDLNILRLLCSSRIFLRLTLTTYLEKAELHYGGQCLILWYFDFGTPTAEPTYVHCTVCFLYCIYEYKQCILVYISQFVSDQYINKAALLSHTSEFLNTYESAPTPT